MMLTAYSLYLNTYPKKPLKLVFTGWPGKNANKIIEDIKRMKLCDWVVYVGYVSKEEYEILMAEAFALIFPSLYEGFGIPVLEAMSVGVPVLCSNLTALPEVAGNAALYFDPRKPIEIVSAIDRLCRSETLYVELAERGKERSHHFGDADKMGEAYSKVFLQILQEKERNYPIYQSGIFNDGWTGEKVEIYFNKYSGNSPRYLELQFEIPSWFESPIKFLATIQGDGDVICKWLNPGEFFNWKYLLPGRSGILVFQIAPTFSPRLSGKGPDERHLGILCSYCRVIIDTNVTYLFNKGASL
jgi:hypothetical protein